MKTIDLIQGTPAWHIHRAQHFNASDAPAMLGVSPYKSRAQLLEEVATGMVEEIDDATQRRFDDGHRFEALARPLAEKIVGEELYPCVGVEGPYSASFDGLTLMEDTAFEHKTLNDDLRAVLVDGCIGADLPAHYRVQMEQQLLVSDADRVLFMATKWKGEQLVEERHCWYTCDPALRERITAGWKQFVADVGTYQPSAAAAPAAVGQAPETMPALRIEVTGMVTASNLAEWREAAITVFQNISTDLQTDQDFANAEQTVKWCGDIEDQLKGAKQHALSQTASIDELFRTIDAIGEQARSKRLELDNLVKARKEAIRGEIVAAGRAAVHAHFDGINATLGQHALSVPPGLVAELAASIKGKKTVSSIKAAVDAAVANAKIAASQNADQVRANVAILQEHGEHGSLFADRVQLCASKAPEDLRNLVSARIADHQQREAQRLEQERERIRQEEVARIESEQAAKAVADSPHGISTAGGVPDSGEFPDRVRHLTGTGSHVQGGGTPAADGPTAAAAATPISSAARVRLGEINARIAPMSITAEGLATLGFKPVGTERAAKLYSEAEFPNMVRALGGVLRGALELQQAA